MDEEQMRLDAEFRETHPKLTIEQQIMHMRDDRGVKFNIMSEEAAADFLRYNSYYFKIKAFRKNYSKYSSGPNCGQYCDLEFAYLRELSIIDMHLREIILAMVIDIEHYLKVRLLRDISTCPEEDGYSIISTFFANHPSVAERIQEKGENSYCATLIHRHSGHFAVWSIVEILSFGDLLNLCDLFYNTWDGEKINVGNFRIVKFLRNAVAHNNCLINNLADNDGSGFKQNRTANRMLAQIPEISAGVRAKKMGNRFVHDFVVMLCCYDEIVSSHDVKQHKMQRLKDFVDVRCVRNREWFRGNALICSNYNFMKKVVDKFASDCI